MKWNVSYVSDLHSTERGRIIKTVAHASANELTTRFGRPAFLADDNDSALYVGVLESSSGSQSSAIGTKKTLSGPEWAGAIRQSGGRESTAP